MAKDHYQQLELSENATASEIKKQFRKLAKKYHPDRNKGKPDAEARFKEINEAYNTLKDEERRKEYDMMRKYGAHPGAFSGMGGRQGFSGASFDPSQFGGNFNFRTSHEGGIDGIEELLSQFFGGTGQFETAGQGRRRQPGPKRGADLVTTVQITFLESVSGVKKTIRLPGRSKSLSVKIPAGIADGGRVRLRGQGEPGLYGGKNGNLIVRVKVMQDKQFKRDGNDIYSSIDISFVEAIKGCRKPVNTLSKKVTLTIPAGTQPGTKLRLKGMGLNVSGKLGDQYVEVKVTIPTELTEKQRKIIEEWEE